MKHIHIFVLVIFFTGCAFKTPTKKRSLEELLIPLASSKQEAFTIANDVRGFSKTLKESYGLIPFPSFNNFLINIGVKERGLCWQLAFDLLSHLKTKNYNVDYYIGGANIGDYFTEHNVVVLTCKGCGFEKGIIFDTWRNGGDLYYSSVDKDESYKWFQRGKKR